MLINAHDGIEPVVGASLLKNYYVNWDIGGRRVGFAEFGNFTASTMGSPNATVNGFAAGNTPTPTSSYSFPTYSDGEFGGSK